MDIQPLQSRSWNGTPISRRTTDNYVNATAMCRANGKRWSDYRESDRCQRYLDALAELTEIPVVNLYQAIEGRGGGTFVHPQVAVDLARWISAPFAVWMDGWFLEELENQRVSQVRDIQPVPQLSDTQRNLEWLMDFTTRWNIRLDERDMLHIKETATMVALPPAGGAQKVFNDYPVSRLVQDLFGVVLKNTQYQRIGRGLARMWRDETSSHPAKHDQYVDGACRLVAHYPKEWAVPALKQLQQAHPDWFQRV